VGKSVVFGILTGRYVTVSNYPGTTVEVTRGTAGHGRDRIRVTDTPGINTLIPQSEDEQVTRDILLDEPGPVVQIGDEKNLARTLLLTLQLLEAGRRVVLCLNMADEAESLGITTDVDRLAARLGVDVIRTVATRREGTGRILPLARRARASSSGIVYDRRIEEAVAEVEPLLPEAALSRRSLALMLLAGDASLTAWLRARLGDDGIARIEEVRLRLARSYTRSVAYVVNEQRLRAASALAQEVSRLKPRRAGRLGRALGDATMHRFWGLPILAAVLFGMYQFVGVFGAGTAVDLLEEGLFGKEMARLEIAAGEDGAPRAVPAPEGQGRRIRLVGAAPPPAGAPAAAAVEVALEARTEETGPDGLPVWAPVAGGRLLAFEARATGARGVPVEESAPGVFRAPLVPGGGLDLRHWTGHANPALYRFLRRWSPWEFLTDFLAGPYGLITMGVTYAIAIVLPIVATFFVAFSFLEDSGYLPRLAAVLNRAFRAMGLNGKAVLPMVLGLGCDTMATLTTRILETRKERLIVILLLALGVPCSAQLGVILGLLAGLSWKAAAVWSGAVLGVIVLVGWGASRIVTGRISDFILEIPPLRLPALGNILTKTAARVEWYLKEAVPLFLVGTVILFAADRTGALHIAERAVSPLVRGVLDLPDRAAEAFIIGFLRRDFGSAGLYRLAEEGLLDPTQIVVSLVTVTLFIPCVANFLMIVKERGLATALAVAAFIFPFAVLAGGALNFGLRALEVSL
jgi:Fe2+ transport system protein B